MRFTTATATLLVAGPVLTTARWLHWSGGESPTSIPQETGALPVAGRAAIEQGLLGWTPKPTPPPGAWRSDQDLVVDYLRRRQGRSSSGSSRNTWTNEQTCGWFQGTPSSAYTCDDKFSCVTNDDHNIACASGTYSPFFTVCLDYNAFKDGACENANSLTGCCQAATEPACGTYIWTGSPTRSMYRCFSSSTIISMLDLPQSVIDASISSASSASSASEASKSSASEASKSSEAARLSSLTASKTGPGSVSATTTEDGQTGQPTSGPGNNGEAGGATDGSDGSDGGSTGDGTSGGGTTNPSTNNGTDAGKTNTPAIVGGVVGGLSALILLILLLMLARRNKWKCTMKRSSNKNTTKRSDRSERKKNYKNTIVKETHHGEKDSYESSHHRDSRTYIREPPPARDPGAAPTQTGSGGLPFPWRKNKGASQTSTSHYAAPVGPEATAPALRDQRQMPPTIASQQQYTQQQGAMDYPKPSLNPSSPPHVQREGSRGNGNNVLSSNQGVPTDAGYQHPQTFSPPAQAQHLAPLTNTDYSSSSVQATGPNYNNDGGNHLGAAAASYQQPQYTGNSSAPPAMMPASTTNVAGSSPQRQNFGLAMNNYANTPGQGNATTTNPNENHHPDAAPAAATGYQYPQFTGSSSSAPGMTQQNTGGFVPAAHSYATGMSPHATGAGYNNGDNFQSGSSSAVPGQQQQPPLSGTPTPASGPSGVATGAGTGAGALAMAGVHLDINNNHNVLQQQQQQTHHYYHQQPGNVTAAGIVPGSQPPQQQQQQKPRYMDSSTMTTDAVVAEADRQQGAHVNDQQQSQSPAAASYQQPQYTGVSAMTSTATGSSINNAGYYQPSHITGLDRHRSISLSPTTPTINGGGSGAGYQQQQVVMVGLPQSTATGTTTTTAATSPMEGNAWNGGSKETGAGAGAWYQRPAGVQDDEPIELEARPALRKVD